MDFFDTVITDTSYNAAVRHLNSFENTFLHFSLVISNKLRLNVCRKNNNLKKNTNLQISDYSFHF